MATASSSETRTDLLDELAREATALVDVRAAAILLLAGGSRLRLAGSFGLSADYGARLRAFPPLGPGHGPGGLAVDADAPIVVEDVVADPRTRPWAGAAASEGYRAMAAIGLSAGGTRLGALTVYRTLAGPWEQRDVELITLFGAAAAHAVGAAHVIRRQQGSLAAQARLITGLRSQAHEHANRIHTLSMLLGIGRTNDALRFVEQLEGDYRSDFDAISRQINIAPPAALIVGATMSARRRGVRIELSEESTLNALPLELDEAVLLTIVGNLLDNAVEEVALMPRANRTVTLRILDDGKALTIEVCNPIAADSIASLKALAKRGYTTKPGHPGLGLSLVESAVSSAFGRLELRVDTDITFRVTVPHG